VTHLDDAVPSWQFREIHRTRIDASPERIFDAIRGVTAGEIRLFRTLTAIRRFGWPCGESILNAPGDQPLLDVATRSGFFYVANDPPRELVVGTNIGRDVFAAMNFLIIGNDVSTETRVVASTTKAKFAFGAYWLLIRAGSGFIRRMWLRAIKRRAEAR
jgi:hypothetical protein